MKKSPRSAIEALEVRIVPAGLPTLDIPSLDGVIGFEISSLDDIGNISVIGDFNGDGLDDFALGAPGAASERGKLYVIYGTASGFPAALDLTNLNGANGFTITGISTGDQLGSAFSNGDLNGDNQTDLAIAATGVNAGGTDRGAVYVIYGGANPGATFDLNTLSGNNGFVFTGTQNGTDFGRRISAAGDINNDGIDDLVVGAPLYDIGSFNKAGVVAVVFGAASGRTATINLETMGSTTGFVIGGDRADLRLGSTVHSGLDFDGDGIDDLGFGGADNDAGVVDIVNGEGDVGFILYGHDGAWVTALISDIPDTEGFAVLDRGSFSLAPLLHSSDLNGDGKIDYYSAGGSYIGGTLRLGVLGALGQGNGAISADPLNAKGAKIVGLVAEEPVFSGSNNFRISTGDFNGDGYLDMIVDRDDNSNAELYFGQKLNGVRVVGKNSTDRGFQFTGLTVGEAMGSANFIGDINGDGFEDVALQAPKVVGSGERVFIVFGSGLQIARGGKSATWTDEDGDIVTAKITKGEFDYTNFRFAPKEVGSKGLRLEELDLTNGNGGFDGTNITISVKRNPVRGEGDGAVKIGKIDATGFDLGTVKIPGALGELDAGDNDLSDGALKALDVRGFGNVGGLSGAETSVIKGAVGKINVRGNVDLPGLLVTDGGSVKSLKAVDFAGELHVSGLLGMARVQTLASGAELSSQATSGNTSIFAKVIEDATIDIGGRLAALQAITIQGAEISADLIGTLKVSGKLLGVEGSLTAEVTVRNIFGEAEDFALNSLQVAYTMSDSSIRVAGSIKTVSIGAVNDSRIFAGFVATNGGTPLDGGVFLAGAQIKTLTVSGKGDFDEATSAAFADSFVAASILGKVRLAGIDPTNGGVQYGFAYDEALGSLSSKAPAFRYDTDEGRTQSSGDFTVRRLTAGTT